MVKVPLKKAIGVIFLVTLLVSGSAALCLVYYKYLQWERVHDSKYEILAIVQASSEKEPLKTVYLAELLDLSVDNPTNIYSFNTKFAERKLLLSPLIKDVSVKKIYPGTIYIQYASYVPIAYLGDYTNTGLDKDGVIIPFKPFFTPKILPEIYLGLESENEEYHLGDRLKGKKTLLALNLLDFLNQHLVSEHAALKKIDVSLAFASSFGQKQIVVIMEDKIEKIKDGRPILCQHLRILRLSSNGYKEELIRYLTLRKYLIQKEKFEEFKPYNFAKIIDLRIPELAFIPR